MRNCKIPSLRRVLKVRCENIPSELRFQPSVCLILLWNLQRLQLTRKDMLFKINFFVIFGQPWTHQPGRKSSDENFGLLGQYSCWPVEQNVFLKVPFCKAIIHLLEETYPKSSKLRLAKNIYYISISSLFRLTGIIEWKPIILHMELWK